MNWLYHPCFSKTKPNSVRPTGYLTFTIQIRISMKTYISTFLSILFFSCSFAQADKDFKNCKDISEIEKQAHARMFDFLAPMAADNYDIVYHECYWEIDPAVSYIQGAIKTFFKPETSAFNELEFDLTTSLNVDSVKYHNGSLSYVQLPGDILRITFPSSIPVGTLDSLTVYYQGIPGSTGFGSFIQSTHNNEPIIWTLSEPYGAKDWWPCKQNLADKIDSIDIIVKVPQVNRVASNGVLLSEDTAGTDKIYHWKSRYPIAAYLVAIAVTNYAYYSDYVPLQIDSLEVLNYVYPENLASAQTQTPAIIGIIQLFDSLTIQYPFANEKYGHAEFGWGGGMEHQTMTFLGGFNYGLLAHECAHQWFGDFITCGSWEDIWLNEGFATYFEGLTVQRYFTSNWMNWKQNKINNITSSPDGSVQCDDTTQVGRIFDGRLSYDKGAYLLHMLRWKLGDTLFFASLKNYLNDTSLSNNFAKTPALKAHFESASGQNLTNFFSQWYYNQGYPTYQIGYLQTLSDVTITVNQTQSDPSVSFFEMPIPIKFIGAGIDTTVVFNNTFSGQTFNTTINFPISTAQFDPELWIVSGSNTISDISENFGEEHSLTAFPNPVKDKLTLTGFFPGTIVNDLQIVDILGKIVYSADKPYNITDKIILNTENLKGGMYGVLLNTNIGIQTVHFIKD